MKSEILINSLAYQEHRT